MLKLIHILLFISVITGLSAQTPAQPVKKTIRQWHLNSDFTEEVPFQIDTVFSLSNHYRISDKYSPINAYPGNYGLPFYQINFFDRISDPDQFLYTYYSPFMYLPGKAQFMDTQVPITEMTWSFGAPRETSEQTFRVRHSQNANRYLNFGVIYDIIFSLGQYNYQRAEDKTFTFYTSYIKKKYKLYMAAGVNNMLSYENGGVTSSDQISLFTGTRDVPVNLGGLDKATSTLKNRNILLVQRYTLGKPATPADSASPVKKGFFGLSGTFSHILLWETNKRMYSDANPKSGFYDSIYISESVTFDSLNARYLKNTVRFDFTTDESRKFRLGGGAGLRNELFRYGQIMPTYDTGFSDTLSWKRNNNAVVGRLYNNIGEKFRWMADGELFLTGYRAGDFTLKGEIDKTFDFKKGPAAWTITGGIENKQPSFWLEQWGSNHFAWNNKFKKEFRIDAGTRFSYQARNADLRFNYALITNFTDFNEKALPSQYDGVLSVASLMAHKEFKAWKFHLSTDVLLQQSSNRDILDLPFISTRTTGFFEHLFRFPETNGKLNTQLGVDLIYHTLYHPLSYMPATGRYYRQNSVSTGNYPFINAFINIKLKRTRFFIMMDHLNAGIMGYNYYMIPLYPMNSRMLRYGLAWTFYN